MDCVFCEIEAGRLPASWVYYDEKAFSILDLVQPNPYKVLVIPRRHVESLYDLTEGEAAALMQQAVIVARGIREVSGCSGLNVLQSNGAVAGQTVFHVHLHLFPRFEGDGITMHWPHDVPSRARLDQLASDLRKALD